MMRTGRPASTVEHFWSKVDVREEDECWEWRGGKDSDGYGGVRVGNRDYRAHRYSWMINYGDIPKNFLVCHKCDNPPCINPKHLFLGTHKDNVNDMISKGRRIYQKGEERYNSKLTWVKVSEIRTLVKTTDLSQSKIAKLYNISEALVSGIVNNKTWVIKESEF